MAKTSGSLFDQLVSQMDDRIEESQRQAIGAEQYKGARKEWAPASQHREENVVIEDLLDDDYYLGSFNIWPAVRQELCDIWHMRCDFEVSFIEPEGRVLDTKKVYALSFEHAARKAKESWPTLAEKAVAVDVRRRRDLHTVVIETPKGTGKDFEMAMIIWLLVREFLIMDREEFFEPYMLDLNTTISINCSNITQEQAKKVTFKEVVPKFDVPFFNDYFPPQINIQQIMEERYLPSELRFPRNVVLFPGTGAASTNLGYCLGSAVIDECNFLTRSDSGKQSILGQEAYDAANELYMDSLQRHRSRLACLRHGREVTAGLVICISSSAGRQCFTKRMEQRAQEDPGIYYVTGAVWDRHPKFAADKISGKTFTFDLNSMSVLNVEQAKKDYADMLRDKGSTEAIDADKISVG